MEEFPIDYFTTQSDRPKYMVWMLLPMKENEIKYGLTPCKSTSSLIYNALVLIEYYIDVKVHVIIGGFPN